MAKFRYLGENQECIEVKSKQDILDLVIKDDLHWFDGTILILQDITIVPRQFHDIAIQNGMFSAQFSVQVCGHPVGTCTEKLNDNEESIQDYKSRMLKLIIDIRKDKKLGDRRNSIANDLKSVLDLLEKN